MQGKQVLQKTNILEQEASININEETTLPVTIENTPDTVSTADNQFMKEITTSQTPQILKDNSKRIPARR